MRKTPPTTSTTTKEPHNPEFMKIMEMVQKGITPPNVRTIDDSPLEDAIQPLKESKSESTKNTKPWQQNE